MWNGPHLPAYNRLVEQQEQVWGSEPALETGSAANASSPDMPAADRFSPLTLRDRVVIMLLFDQVVREEQVERAWQLWKQMPAAAAPEPLWRVLTLFPDLDRDLVYAEAARVYGFDEARIVRPHALAQIQDVEAHLPAPQWDALVDVLVVPIAQEDTPSGPRRVLATQDPTRPEVHRLLPTLDLGAYTLQFAREQDLLNLLVEAFPQRYSHLKELSGLSQKLLQHGADADHVFEWGDGADAEQEVTSLALACFDDALKTAVRHGASDLCLLASPAGVTEVYLQRGDDLHRVHVIDAVNPVRFRETIKREVVGVEECTDGRIRKCVVERRVDGRSVRFRVAVVPAGEAVPAECLVVHVLG